MAAQGRPGLVVDERSLTVRAGLDMTAIPAQHHGRSPTAIEHEDGLLPRADIKPRDRLIQGPRDRPAVAVGQLKNARTNGVEYLNFAGIRQDKDGFAIYNPAGSLRMRFRVDL